MHVFSSNTSTFCWLEIRSIFYAWFIQTSVQSSYRINWEETINRIQSQIKSTHSNEKIYICVAKLAAINQILV